MRSAGQSSATSATGSVEGASTITQQLARTLFLSNRKSYVRKSREAVLSLLMEAQLSKRQILELYLNRIYLSAGVYGVEAMSQRVFGKPASRLTLAESAFIAGLARAPGALSPWSNREGAVARSHVVLARMREAGFITEADERAARRAPIRVRPYRSPGTARDGYARDYLRQQFRNVMGATTRPTGASTRRSCRRCSVPPSAAWTSGCAGSADRICRRRSSSSTRRPATSWRWSADATMRALRSIGRAAAAGSPGRRSSRCSLPRPWREGYSPVSTLDGLATLAPQGPDEWAPSNVGGAVPDVLTLRAALIESNNRAATRLQQRLGTRRVLALASRAGLRDLPDVPSLSLGTGVVSPLELTAAYAMFPNGGFAVVPRSIVRMREGSGSAAGDRAVEATRVLPPEVASQMVSMLADVVDRGTASRVRRLGVRFPVGGKTGTTDDFRDAWFVGFSSSLVVGVWVGYDQPRTIAPNAFGARYALPIWADFMRRAAPIREPAAFVRDPGLEEETLCRVSYQQPVEWLPRVHRVAEAGGRAPGAAVSPP